jgi:membrane associated rhomboid family serine protease
MIIAGIFITFWKKMLLSHMIIILMSFGMIFIVATTIFSTTWLDFSVVSYDLAFRPVYLVTGERLYTMVTNVFIHGNFFHFLFNFLAILFLCLSFEEQVGTLRFGIIFFGANIIAAILYALSTNFGSGGLVGASGGVFGIIGAYARLYPNKRFAFLPIPYPLPIYTWAFIFLLAGILFSLVPDLCLIPNVAHLAHVFALFAGLAIAPIVMKIPIKDTKKKEVTQIDFKALESLAQTDEQKELLEKIRSEDEPEVRDAWLEHFISRAKCPECGGMMMKSGRTLRCTCGREIRY